MSVRRTKIVATLGPASNSPEVLEQLILAGIDVARLNFSHGTPDEHRARARLVRELAAKHGRFVALLGDLQGPKIRIAKFANKRIELQVGDKFRFSTSHARDAGTQEVVGIDYPDLVKDCGVGDELLLDDGRVVMVVEEVAADELRCRVLIGGPLSDHKGINRRGGGLTAPALTDKDKADIKLAADMDLDYVAVSFPRDAKDMEYARRLLTEAGGKAATGGQDRARRGGRRRRRTRRPDSCQRRGDGGPWRPWRGNRRCRAGRHPEEDHPSRPPQQ